jgi:hypothetical protein
MWATGFMPFHIGMSCMSATNGAGMPIALRMKCLTASLRSSAATSSSSRSP